MDLKLDRLEKKIGYTFINKDLLAQSLTHSSYAYEHQKEIKDNEILEFLGDSVLGFILCDFLYKNFQGLSEGELSKLKSAAASTNTLSLFAREIKLDKKMMLGRGEKKSGGRNKKTILAGMFEALVAALYLDGGINAAKGLLEKQFLDFFKKIDMDHFLINNYKSALQEHLQKENLPPPTYKTVRTKGPEHNKRFTIEVFSNKQRLGKATGLSKKEAEQKAAQKAIKTLLNRKFKSLTSDTFIIEKKDD
ncbi:MAG: ribonuclease III [Candidatus Aminicenantes bacterium]|nr:ribonuclease III [Candidatus Aminicenantes bacterium]